MDIKYANYIFVEHKKLLNENKLLTEQVDNLFKVNNNWQQIDSLKTQKFNIVCDNYQNQINQLQQDLKKKNNTSKYWKIGGITVSLGLLLWLIFK